MKTMLPTIEAAVLAAKPDFVFAPPASDAELATSARLLGVDEALEEIAFLRTNPADAPLPSAFCPLLADGGGGLWIHADRNGGEIWRYDRGDILGTTPFDAWLSEVLDDWTRERHALRVEFLRTGRSMLGWQQLELPTEAKERLVAWLRDPDAPLLVEPPHGAVLRIGESVSWELTDSGLAIVLTREAAGAMAETLTNRDDARVGDLDAKLSFSER